MSLRGIRGAIIIKGNKRDKILSATKKLLECMTSVNKVRTADIASIIFSTTKDLNAEFPAVAARELGYIYTPLLCTNEIAVAGSSKGCIRILMHVNTHRSQQSIKHIYLGKAQKLRPDLNSKLKSKYYLS